MEIDAYQLCPCQSGKKIKFCCAKEIVSELNEVLKKSNAGQVKAALDKLERTAKKVGFKDCLLAIKIRLMLSTGDIEQAQNANQEFLKKSPDHPMALEYKALLALMVGDWRQAVFNLQDAMDARKSPEIPTAVGKIYQAMFDALLVQGRILSATAHLAFAERLLGDDDENIIELWRSTVEEKGVPSFLLQRTLVEPGPDDVPWAKFYLNAQRAIERGQFRRALQYFLKIENDGVTHPSVLRGIAVTKSMLAMDDAAEAWRRYGDLEGLNSTLAAEAHAFAYHESGEWLVRESIIRYRYSIDDADQVVEKLLASRVFAEWAYSFPSRTFPKHS